jgi:hypothetical protein
VHHCGTKAHATQANKDHTESREVLRRRINKTYHARKQELGTSCHYSSGCMSRLQSTPAHQDLAHSFATVRNSISIVSTNEGLNTYLGRHCCCNSFYLRVLMCVCRVCLSCLAPVGVGDLCLLLCVGGWLFWGWVCASCFWCPGAAATMAGRYLLWIW